MAPAVFAALVQGGAPQLAELNLANNKFAKKSPVPPATIGQYFGTAAHLRRIGLAGMRIPTEVLDAVLQRLNENRTCAWGHVGGPSKGSALIDVVRPAWTRRRVAWHGWQRQFMTLRCACAAMAWATRRRPC